MRFSENTQKLIDERLSKPFEIGDEVTFYGAGNGSKDPSFSGSGEITDINGNKATIRPRSYGIKTVEKDFSELKQSYFTVGANPIVERRFYQKYSIDLRSLLSRLGYDHHGQIDETKSGLILQNVSQCNTDPVVLLNNGEYHHYQRGLVWKLVDKQKLIRSLYDGINIGNFVFRSKSYDSVMSDKGNTKYPVDVSWSDLVDGKQRVDAILGFIQGKFTDHLGNYWGDLSISTRSKILSINNMMYIEMPESTTDAEVLEYFILLNDTGKPIDQNFLKTNKEIFKTYE